MKYTKALAVGILTLALGAAASSTASADVQLTLQNGRVTLSAKDATLRQILAEWARVGQIKIVNGERVPGAPLTVQFNNVPEQQVLDTLLRGLSGYVAQSRETFQGNLSRYDRILVMPTLAAAVTAVNTVAPPPTFPQPNTLAGQQGLSAPDDQDEDRAPNRGPVFNTFPQPQAFPVPNGPNPNFPNQPGLNPNGAPLMLPPPAQATPNQAPGSAYPGGVSVPGMIVPAPVQPGQPGLPGLQIPPKRPGGIDQ